MTRAALFVHDQMSLDNAMHLLNECGRTVDQELGIIPLGNAAIYHLEKLPTAEVVMGELEIQSK